MKVESKDFSKFLDKINIGGKIEDVVLEFKEEGIFCKAVDRSNIMMVQGFLSKTKIEDYEILGEIGIAGLSRFKNIISRFDKKLELIKSDNYLTINKGSNREGKFILPNTDFIKESREFPSVDYDATFKAPIGILKSSAANASIVDAVTFILEVVKNSLSIQVGEVDHLIERCEIEATGTEKIMVGDILTNIIKVCDDDLVLSIKSESPLFLKDEKNEIMKFNYMVAALVE